MFYNFNWKFRLYFFLMLILFSGLYSMERIELPGEIWEDIRARYIDSCSADEHFHLRAAYCLTSKFRKISTCDSKYYRSCLSSRSSHYCGDYASGTAKFLAKPNGNLVLTMGVNSLPDMMDSFVVSAFGTFSKYYETPHAIQCMSKNGKNVLLCKRQKILKVMDFEEYINYLESLKMDPSGYYYSVNPPLPRVITELKQIKGDCVLTGKVCDNGILFSWIPEVGIIRSHETSSKVINQDKSILRFVPDKFGKTCWILSGVAPFNTKSHTITGLKKITIISEDEVIEESMNLDFDSTTSNKVVMDVNADGSKCVIGLDGKLYLITNNTVECILECNKIRSIYLQHEEETDSILVCVRKANGSCLIRMNLQGVIEAEIQLPENVKPLSVSSDGKSTLLKKTKGICDYCFVSEDLLVDNKELLQSLLKEKESESSVQEPYDQNDLISKLMYFEQYRQLISLVHKEQISREDIKKIRELALYLLGSKTYKRLTSGTRAKIWAFLRYVKNLNENYMPLNAKKKECVLL